MIPTVVMSRWGKPRDFTDYSDIVMEEYHLWHLCGLHFQPTCGNKRTQLQEALGTQSLECDEQSLL